MKTLILSAFLALTLAPHAHAECDVKMAIDHFLSKQLATKGLALDSIDKVTKQRDGSYAVEFAYLGSDFRDGGFAQLVVDERTCVAKAAR